MKKQAKLATFFPSAFCGLDLGTEGGRNMNIERDINITNSRRFPELFELPHLYSSHRWRHVCKEKSPHTERATSLTKGTGIYPEFISRPFLLEEMP